MENLLHTLIAEEEHIDFKELISFITASVADVTPSNDILQLFRTYCDFMPFYDFSPTIRDVRTVGNGIRFLNRYMSSSIFSRPREWLDKSFSFVKMHHYQGQQLLVNGAILTEPNKFLTELENTLEWLETKPAGTPYSKIKAPLKKSGFEVGWGNTAGRIRETMQILLNLVGEPTDDLLETFISRVPMPLISRIAIISPHGWFGQTNALGKPDTGGQVIYILDQVRALEKHLKELALTGLEIVPKIIVLTRLIPEAQDTTCNQRLEKIFNTENGWILRVPFRDDQYNVVKNWVSRFKVWPYLETFAEDAATELTGEFRAHPIWSSATIQMATWWPRYCRTNST
jgi:sucrose synthase